MASATLPAAENGLCHETLTTQSFSAQDKDPLEKPVQDQSQAQETTRVNEKKYAVEVMAMEGKNSIATEAINEPSIESCKSVKVNSNKEVEGKKNKTSQRGKRELNAILNASKSAIAESVNGNDTHSNGDVNGGKRNGRSKKRRTSESEDSEGRVGKRVRLQHQPFQATPSAREISQLFKASSSSSHNKKDKDPNPDKLPPLFQKGEFLAVRNESGGFYICRAIQNVYKTSRKFKIQWFNDEGCKDVYLPDYCDITDFDCILTNVKLFTLSKGKYNLPHNEKQRIMNILQRALNVEKGVEVPDPKTVSADGIDVSIVGQLEAMQSSISSSDTEDEEQEEEEEEEKEVKPRGKKTKKEIIDKETFSRKPVGRPRKQSVASSTTSTSTIKEGSKRSKSRRQSVDNEVTEKETKAKNLKRRSSVDKISKESNVKQTSSVEKNGKKSEKKKESDKKEVSKKSNKLKVDNDVSDTSLKTNGKEEKKSQDKLKGLNQTTLKRSLEAKKLAEEVKNRLQAKMAFEMKAAAASKIASKRKSVEQPEPIVEQRSSRSRTSRNVSPSEEKNNVPEERPFRVRPERAVSVTDSMKSGASGKETNGKAKVKVTPLVEKKPVELLELIGFECKAVHAAPVVSPPVKENKSRIEVAIRCGDDKTVNECIRSGGDLSVDVLTNLAFIASTHCPQTIPTFISHGVDVKSVDPLTGNTLLHFVSSLTKKSVDLVSVAQLLISKGSEVNAQNLKKKTAMHLASAAAVSNSVLNDYDSPFLEFLVDSGADVSIRDDEGRIPLFYAFIKSLKPDDHTYSDPIEQVVLLSRKLNLNGIKDNLGHTPLHRAAYRGATVSCMHLLRLVSDKDPLDFKGNSPLAFAVLNGHDGCSLALINAGCDFTLKVTKPVIDCVINASKWSFIHEPSKKKETTSSILREVIEKNWGRSRIFLMNHLSSVGSSRGFGIDACLRARRLKLSLKTLSQTTNEEISPSDGQRLITTLCEAALPSDDNETQRQILKALIERRISEASFLDESGSSAIVKAAANLNHVLCEDLTNLLGPEKVVSLKPNSYLQTPLTAMLLKREYFTDKEKKDLTREMKTWGATLVSEGATFNCLAYYPLKLSSFPGICPHPVATDDISQQTKLSPLMIAVLYGNYSVVKYLVQQKADLNFADDEGRTAIMFAAQLNDLKMMKLLLNLRYEPEFDSNAWNSRFLTFKQTSGLDLTRRDKKGRTIVHYVVNPFPEISFATASVIIRLLKEVGAPLDAPDFAGITPLQLASSLGLSSIVDTLIELLPDLKEEDKKSILLPRLCSLQSHESLDFMKEALSYCTQHPLDTKSMMSVKSDPLLGFGNSSEIVADTCSKIPLTTLLIKPDHDDLSNLLFFKLQVVEHKERNIILLFTRWGRIPEVGEYKKTTCSTKSEAIEDFKKMFALKTGNEWDTVLKTQNVAPVPNKYRVVFIDPETQRSQEAQKLLFPIDKLKSDNAFNLNISSETKNLLLDILSHVQSAQHEIIIDPLVLCNKLTQENINSAKILCESMMKLIEEKNLELKSCSKKSLAAPKVIKILEQITDINCQMYNQIPLPDKRLILPAFHEEAMKMKMVLLDKIRRQVLFNQILFAMEFKKNIVHPLEYFSKCLTFYPQPLEPQSLEAQILIRFVSRTSKTISIDSVFALQGRQESLVKPNNSWLLFSEINKQDVFASIIGEPVPFTSGIFGEGLYFSDAADKVFTNETRQYIVVSEVSLGNVQEVSKGESYPVLPASGYQSVRTKTSKQYPDPCQAIQWKGRTIPNGSLILSSDTAADLPLFHSFMVKDRSQMTLRYLLVLDTKV